MDAQVPGTNNPPTSSAKPSVRLCSMPPTVPTAPVSRRTRSCLSWPTRACESTFYRVLKAAGMNRRRGRSKAPVARPLTTHRADAPNQLWCWDITWMPSTVKGRFFYWYMVKDVYSRKLIANEVHEAESSQHASQLLHKACLREQTAGSPPSPATASFSDPAAAPCCTSPAPCCFPRGKLPLNCIRPVSVLIGPS
ncbi:DDE-type integrase/transposase/recombinase [Delftia tsuruhatensis]|uniref:DDE-type integrase/transposase/recombinase n=1 Tax=Delftia tsuruhatensis TaxID=180282 RepID=UPI003BAA1018